MENRRPSRQWRIAVISTAAALIVAVAVVWPRAADVLRARALVRAAAALRFRPIAGRIDGFAYVAASAVRGDRPDADVGLRAEASRILQDSAAPALRGKALLLTDRAAEAAQELERAATASGDASVLANLAAARVAQADGLDAIEPAVSAAIAARQAIERMPRLAAGHFNLALALERIGLVNEAAAEFATAAAIEPGSAWASEALGRAKTLSEAVRSVGDWRTAERRLRDSSDSAERKAIVASNLPVARKSAEGPYLVAWAQARVAGHTDAARDALALAHATAEALRDLTDDRFAWDAVAAIERAEAAGDEQALQLARAHIVYGQGRIARRDHDDTRAIPLLARAAEELAAAGSPLQFVARYQIAGAYYEQARIEETLAQIESLNAPVLQAKGYRALVAQLGWEQGNSLLVRGAYEEAFDVFDRSYALALACRDDDLAASFDGFAAQALEYLGDRRQAWRRRARALRMSAVVGNGYRRAVTLASAANSQLAARDWAAAAMLLDYALPLAESARDPLVTGLIHAERAVGREELGDRARAARDRADASAAVRQVAAVEVRQRLAGFVNIAEGVAHRNESRAAAIAYFDRAIDHQKRSGQSSLLPRLYYERARARGGTDRAGEKRDLRAGLAVVANWERSITTPEQRAAVSVWGDAMRRDLIARELDDGDVAAAFASADARPSPVRSESRDLQATRAALAPDAAIVELARTGEKMVVFVVRRDSAVAATLAASATDIAAAAEKLRGAADDHFGVAAVELFHDVFEPIASRLQGVRTIAFVPDQELKGVSLGALRDAATNRYVAEEYIVVHAPTAGAAIEASRHLDRRNGMRALVIAANDFDRTRHPELSQLPEVAREADLIAEVWREARVLAGPLASSVNVAAELPQASVVHYGGHIVGRGAESRLILTGSSDLSARAVSRMRLDKTRVVILAACRGSAGAEIHATYSDMATAFLAAGVPTVIASGDDVDDSRVTAAMVHVSRFLRDGDDAAAALRNSIVAERSAGDHEPLLLRFVALGGARSLVP